MRFELVQARLRAMPSDLPEPPAVLTPIRIDAAEALHEHGPLGPGRRAAVLVLLFPDAEGQARVLLTARVPHLAAHAGEVSFPGGSADPDDADPVATALREAAEEVDLDPVACQLRVVGPLEHVFIRVSGFRITPVVAIAERRPILRAAPGEVARIIEAPVEAFLPDAPVELEERAIRERLIRYGLYPVEGERVWGATARMLGQLGALLAAELAAEPEVSGPPGATAAAAAAEPEGLAGLRIERASSEDAAVVAFLAELAPELARPAPVGPPVLVARTDTAGRAVVGVASWAGWRRPGRRGRPGTFGELEIDAANAAELTLLAVAPALRGRGVGRRLLDAGASAARDSGAQRLLAWTLADSVFDTTATAARAFFRSNGFRDLVVHRGGRTPAEERLLLERGLVG